MKERKATKPFILMTWFKPAWSTTYSGEEYEPDGRDWRELRIFLEVNPETLDKREIFVSHALGFLDDKFWDVTGHRLFHLLKHYGRYGNHKRTPRTKVENQHMIHCTNCGKDVPADHDCDISQIPEHLR